MKTKPQRFRPSLPTRLWKLSSKNSKNEELVASSPLVLDTEHYGALLKVRRVGSLSLCRAMLSEQTGRAN